MTRILRHKVLGFPDDVPGRGNDRDLAVVPDLLKTLREVGLDYLELGQSATILFGGEAQRVKISSELYKPHLQKTIYILDEPIVGLRYEDVQKN